jgi:hypothetical protein
MNHMPIAQAIQWHAQLAIDRGMQLTFNSAQLRQVEAQEREAILNG